AAGRPRPCRRRDPRRRRTDPLPIPVPARGGMMARPVLRTTARGKQGPRGPQGERGPQGLPATGAAEDDAAIATFATTPGTATHGALTGGIDARIDTRVPGLIAEQIEDANPDIAAAAAALAQSDAGLARAADLLEFTYLEIANARGAIWHD